ncbi:MAG: DNA recombination protein RmuC, partial [Caulobacterales bacterium]|nr:DNA recombination protein RmuC [Caulobacterales bacterium]
MPAGAFEFQATLSNRMRADCLIRLPDPPGSVVVDAKFPLESWRSLSESDDEAVRETAARAFRTDMLKHVTDIASKYLIPGETADTALLFLPSEAVYAAVHADFPDIVEKSFKKRVMIVSPTTFMATLHTMRAVMRDARMREQAHVIQREVGLLSEDVRRLDSRVGNLQRHFDQAGEDVRQIRISADKVVRRAERIEDAQVETVETDGAAGEPARLPAAS